MVIGSGGRSFDVLVSAEFHLLTGLAAFLNDKVGDGLTVDNDGFEFVHRLHFVGHGCGEDLFCHFDETGVLGNEVRFTLEGNDCCEVAFIGCENAAFRSLTVLALGGYCLTFLAEDLNGGFDIAVSLGESFFAVHQAGACEVAQLGNFCHCYCHICYL